MAELTFTRDSDALTLTLGGATGQASWSAIAALGITDKALKQDARACGRRLFEAAFADPSLRAALHNLEIAARLLLLIDDPDVAAVPWEYLRDEENRLLASRVCLVRSLPEARRKPAPAPRGQIEIVAIPVSPIDERQLLNTGEEWRRLMAAVRTAGKALRLTRVRPPTLRQVERALSRERASIVHFMGHSGSNGVRSVLEFEDDRARTSLADADQFAEALHGSDVFMVILNSCESALASDNTTQFGNLARGLVDQGIPYALGMQLRIPDAAALDLSKALFDFLLKGDGAEEAVRRMRRQLLGDDTTTEQAYLAGIPALYTSLREAAPPLRLGDGLPTITPDPQRLAASFDLSALKEVDYFVGRVAEIGQVIDALLGAGFVTLYGLGGAGKTTLAQAAANHVGYAFEDRALAYSFETFAHIDEAGEVTVNEAFADTFYTRLATFYGIDPQREDLRPPEGGQPTALKQAILHARRFTRSLLVLDNLETLIDAQKRDLPTARALAAFVSRLKEGDGGLLITTRALPPADWGSTQVIKVEGLSHDAAADLFYALLHPDRQPAAALSASRLRLAARVYGHALSVRLLAGRFNELAVDLDSFLTNIEDELAAAEQDTPDSLEDPERQRTLYACIAYSVKRLTGEQQETLRAAALFRAAFPPEFVTLVMEDEHAPAYLQELARLGLLEMRADSFPDGTLERCDLHPMLRWYAGRYLPPPDDALRERYGLVYAQLARQAYDPITGYNGSASLRALVRDGLADFDAALDCLPPEGESALAYLLADLYLKLGQPRRALALYERALELYEARGDRRNLAATQGMMATLLLQQGQPDEALRLYQAALETQEQLGDPRDAAVTQNAMADLLRQQGKLDEALRLYQAALETKQQLGDQREVAVTQSAMADVLAQQGQPDEALRLYQAALDTQEQLGDRRSAAVTQHAMADMLRQQGQPDEALRLYQAALDTTQQLGDLREVAVTQGMLAQLWFRQGEPRAAIDSLWQAQQTLARLGMRLDAEAMARTLQRFKARLGAARFDALWAEVTAEPQPDWLRDVQAAPPSGQSGLMAAINAYVNAAGWDATRRVVEAQQALLFTPEAEAIFEQNIADAQAENNDQAERYLQFHLDLLRDCQANGIGAAFARLAAAQAAEEDTPDLPFDAELLPQTLAALLGSPQERMAQAQRVAGLLGQAADADLKAFLNAVQMALYGGDLAALGDGLQGVYRQAWQALALAVEAGGIDPRTFAAIAENTVAVLGAAAAQRSQWRSDAANARNGAVAQGARGLAGLLDAVIALLDANGDPAGLGGGLQGIYAQTWQQIVERLKGAD